VAEVRESIQRQVVVGSINQTSFYNDSKNNKTMCSMCLCGSKGKGEGKVCSGNW
jgi:hypothetical protein